MPAERGVLVLINQDQEEYTTLYSRRKAILEGPIPVSRTILDKVLRERKALLSRHILHSEFRKSKSLYTAGVESVLSIPLTVGEKLLGGIYLETSEPNGFDKRHLDLLVTVGGTAALAFENSAQFERLEAETRRLKEDLGYQNNMIGESSAIKGVLKVISRVATTQATVMITGESGTGKELAARAIHINSIRSEFPFVVINCAAITESLLESELFGHEKGAFTGAINQKKGKIEIADGGTLFLDEIGELALPLQSKLLRFVQEMEFERIGGLKTLKVDVRLIAATNLDLKSAVLEGSFREDLYYRLNVVAIEMPPLRERVEDIPLLAQYFVSKFNRAGRRVQGISKEALRLLTQYHWPGNIRELQNVIERAVALGNKEQIETSDLPQSLLTRMDHPEKRPLNFHTAIEKQKKDLILQAVSESNGNITRAAKLLELQPTYLHRLIKNLSLRDEIRKNR
jgi:transcriptional regulator with GAF, ATPase, and Fis domain